MAPPHLVLFDGDCGVCTKAATFAGKHTANQGFIYKPYQQIDEQHLKSKYGISYEDCSSHLRLISPNLSIQTGAEAVNKIALHIPQVAPLVGLLYLFPFMLAVEAIVYELIAKNRAKISKRLGLTECQIRHEEQTS